MKQISFAKLPTGTAEGNAILSRWQIMEIQNIHTNYSEGCYVYDAVCMLLIENRNHNNAHRLDAVKKKILVRKCYEGTNDKKTQQNIYDIKCQNSKNEYYQIEYKTVTEKLPM